MGWHRGLNPSFLWAFRPPVLKISEIQMAVCVPSQSFLCRVRAQVKNCTRYILAENASEEVVVLHTQCGQDYVGCEAIRRVWVWSPKIGSPKSNFLTPASKQIVDSYLGGHEYHCL